MLEGVDYGAMRFFLDAAQALGLLVLFVYTWITQRSKANRNLIDQVEQKHDERGEELEGRMKRVEHDVGLLHQQVQQVPTHYDLGRVYERLNGVSEQVENLSGQFSGLSHQLSLISQHLLSNDRDRR